MGLKRGRPASAFPRMTSAPPVRHRRLLWLVAAIAAAGAGVFSLSSDWLTSAENHATDLLFQARGAVGGEPPTVIVGVAESSFDQAERFGSAERPGVVALMKRDWPWNRRVFAETVRKLRAHGARAIVFDIVFGA